MKLPNKSFNAMRFLIPLAPFILLGGLFLLFEAWEFMTLPQAKDIEWRIKTDLPKGTDKAKVLAFLDAYEFSHSGLKKADALSKRATDYEHEKIKRQIDLIQYHAFGWRYTASWGFWQTHIQVVFYFDSEGKLIEYTPRHLKDGP